MRDAAPARLFSDGVIACANGDAASARQPSHQSPPENSSGLFSGCPFSAIFMIALVRYHYNRQEA